MPTVSPELHAKQLSAVSLHISRVTDELVELGKTVCASEELDKARSFRFCSDRRTYLGSHGFLRDILARETGIAAGNLQFAVMADGKPFLRHSTRLQFSLSHSGTFVVVATHSHQPVGVDIEVRPISADAIHELADEIFTGVESQDFGQLPADQREKALRIAWTRKEAVLKATGTGLTVSPRLVQTGIIQIPQLVTVPCDSTESHYLVETIEVTGADVQEQVVSVAIRQPGT